jgi:hypothetical protein
LEIGTFVVKSIIIRLEIDCNITNFDPVIFLIFIN